MMLQPEPDRTQYGQPSPGELLLPGAGKLFPRPEIKLEPARPAYGIEHVLAAIERLRKLKAGWLDGAGEAMPKKGLDWLSEMVRKHFSGSAAKPSVFPTPEGGVSLEWQGGASEASLEINLAARKGEWTNFSMEPNNDEMLDLSADAGWKRLLALVRALGSARS